MRSINFFVLLIVIGNPILAQGVWSQKADVGGNGRLGAVGFSIDNFGYVGTGSGSPTDWLMVRGTSGSSHIFRL